MHAAYVQALTDAAAAPVWLLLGELLSGYGTAYAEAKRARSAVDFDDLELFARDLLAGDAAIQARYAERFARIMVDEFQDTNALQLELLDLLGTERAFYVGDAQQSIYRFRHASVELFAKLGDDLAAAGKAEQLATNFRTRKPVLDAVNQAFGQMERFVPLVAGREHGPDTGARVELLLTDCEGWDAIDLGALPSGKPDRCAEARLVAQRVRDLVDAGDCMARRRLCPAAREHRHGDLRARAGGPGVRHAGLGRTRLLGAPAGARPDQLPRGAGQSARRGGAARRPGVADRGRRLRRPRAARPRRRAPRGHALGCGAG